MFTFFLLEYNFLKNFICDLHFLESTSTRKIGQLSLRPSVIDIYVDSKVGMGFGTSGYKSQWEGR